MSNEKALQQTMTAEQAGNRAAVVESIVLRGDISGLGPRDRAAYYITMCERLGLDAYTKPFEFLRLNGKEIMYATRGATDQLARIHNVTRKIIDGPRVIDLAGTKLVYCVCEASLPGGRAETSIATLPLTDPAMVYMKAEAKAKRRATLGILALGMLDDAEVADIPAGSKAPGGGVDLSRANDPADEADVHDAEVDEAPLAPFHAGLPGLADAAAGARLWHEHRAVLNAAHETDRRAAWDALVKRTVKFGGGVGSASAAKNFLKDRLAELAPKPVKAVDPAPVADAPVEASPVDAAPEAPAPAPADEPVAVPFVEQLARCATLDAVATLWLAAREDIAQGTKADQAAAWGAAVERLAVIQHCAPSKALGTLLTKRVRILAGDEPDPNGPKGGHAASEAAPLASVNGHSEAASANDAAPAALHRVLDTDTAHLRVTGTWRATEAGWREHLAAIVVRRHLMNSVACNGAALGPRFLAAAAARLVEITPADPTTGARLNLLGALPLVERAALDGSRDRARRAVESQAA